MNDSIGKLLKNHRESQGISLGDVSRDTHISKRFLEAIEREDFQKLPGMVFVRGFIKTYADYIGLDSRAALENYRNAFEKGGEKDPAISAGPGFREPPVILPSGKGKKIFWPVIAGFLILAGTSFYFRDYVITDSGTATHPWTQSAEEKNPPAFENPEPVPEEEPASSVPQNPTEAGVMEAQGEDTAVPPPLPEPVEEEKQETLAVEGEEKPPASLEEAAGPPEPASSGREEREKDLTLDIRAGADAWIRLQIDGKEDRKDFILKKGETASFKARDKFSLSTGNARAVRLLFNGRDIPWPEEKAVIRDFTLTRQDSAGETQNPEQPSEDAVRHLP